MCIVNFIDLKVVSIMTSIVGVLLRFNISYVLNRSKEVVHTSTHLVCTMAVTHVSSDRDISVTMRELL